MGPGPHIAGTADLEDMANGCSVPGMAATGDRGARYDFEQVVVMAGALTQIGVEIDRYHVNWFRNMRRAWAALTGAKTILAPGRT